MTSQDAQVRFARIMALEAKQEIFPGEEITVNYGYKVTSSLFVALLVIIWISVVITKSHRKIEIYVG